MSVQIILFMLGAVVGIYLIAVSVQTFAHYYESYYWHIAPGRILKSRIKSEDRDDEDERYDPDVEYEYDVGSRHYFGRAIGFTGMHGLSRDVAEQVVQRYPTGAQVSVLYDPRHPDHTVLTRRMNLLIVLLLAVSGSTLLILSLLALQRALSMVGVWLL